jgi:hypothetical protein
LKTLGVSQDQKKGWKKQLLQYTYNRSKEKMALCKAQQRFFGGDARECLNGARKDTFCKDCRKQIESKILDEGTSEADRLLLQSALDTHDNEKAKARRAIKIEKDKARRAKKKLERG